jgi:GrpB-like predicted nucleotidyltransferase (UPF0157 family)
MAAIIETYNPEWKTEFEKLKLVFEVVLSGLDIEIEHVGSTSVPGMFAKPVLDIDLIIKNEDTLRIISSKLEEIGYQAKGEQGVSGRFAFRQTSGNTPLTARKNTWQSHHLYVCLSESLALKNHLLFRDALRNDKYLVEKYSQLKKTLVEDYRMTREVYTIRKTDFIISVLKSAGLEPGELLQIYNANI